MLLVKIMAEAQEGYNEEQLKNMLKRLADDLRVAQEEARIASKTNAELQAKEQERVKYIEKLESDMEQVKNEKKRVYSDIIDKDIKPYLTKMKQAGDSNVVTAVEHMENTLRAGHENAFMNPDEQNTLRFVSAIASADAIRSSELAGLLTSEQEWGTKYEALLKQNQEIKTSMEEQLRQQEAANALKDKMVQDLKEELDKLKKSVNNRDGHFSDTAVVEEENSNSMVPLTKSTTAVVGSVASSGAVGIDSIFDFRRPSLFSFEPKKDWRSTFPEPGNGRLNAN
jgi:hypothetical protein